MSLVVVKIHQKVHVANGVQWVEVWADGGSVNSMEARVSGARAKLADLRAKFPDAEFRGESIVHTEGDW